MPNKAVENFHPEIQFQLGVKFFQTKPLSSFSVSQWGIPDLFVDAQPLKPEWFDRRQCGGIIAPDCRISINVQFNFDTVRVFNIE